MPYVRFSKTACKVVNIDSYCAKIKIIFYIIITGEVQNLKTRIPKLVMDYRIYKIIRNSEVE